MDNEALKLIARLKINAARLGLAIDVVRFASDRPYARAVLSKFSDASDEEGVVLALQIMNKLRLSPPAPAPTPIVELPTQTSQEASDTSESSVDKKYVGRLR